MKLCSFQIKNFRSIVDTGRIKFSKDNVTVLVGQNESGKTAVLEALSLAFTRKIASPDDFRYGETACEISLGVEFTVDEMEVAYGAIGNADVADALKKFIPVDLYATEWLIKISREKDDASKVSKSNRLMVSNFPDIKSKVCAEFLKSLLKNLPPGEQADGAKISEQNSLADAVVTKSIDELCGALYEATPDMVLFQETSGTLPNRIDINDDFTLPAVAGTSAVRNLLSIGGLNLRTLVTSENRTQAKMLGDANKKITSGFLEFWTQTFSEKSSISICCELYHYPAGNDKAGKPYLEFFVNDEAANLYPGQRSRGTVWFISFYLQLQASSMKPGLHCFLLDEPGANLHEKAQTDVLRLIEKIKDNTAVIYSTHSPHLISEKIISRILAVERDASQVGFPTRVMSSHALGAASIDTLSPIYTKMGASFSRQSAIKTKNNVILEELSAFYYLSAFFIMREIKREVNFIPATGVSNIPIFVNIFLGWGLEFIVLLDDESSGRGVFKQLKRDLFRDDEAEAARRLKKIRGCEGIEDLFSTHDYQQLVLEGKVTVTGDSNSRWAKKNGAAKAINALNFLQAVQRGDIMWSNLQGDTQTRVDSLVKDIVQSLDEYPR